jgi:hypothetical protein
VIRSDLKYTQFVQQVNNKALYGTELLRSGLYGDGAAAFSSAYRIHANGVRPCSSGLRNVRGTYQSGLADWVTGARLLARSGLTSGTRYFKRGTAKINYATNQLKTFIGR